MFFWFFLSLPMSLHQHRSLYNKQHGLLLTADQNSASSACFAGLCSQPSCGARSFHSAGYIPGCWALWNLAFRPQGSLFSELEQSAPPLGGRWFPGADSLLPICAVYPGRAMLHRSNQARSVLNRIMVSFPWSCLISILGTDAGQEWSSLTTH